MAVVAAISVLIAFFVGASTRRDCECTRIKGHLWGPVRDDGPAEESGECVRCGLYASEGQQECLPEEKTLP